MRIRGPKMCEQGWRLTRRGTCSTFSIASSSTTATSYGAPSLNSWSRNVRLKCFSIFYRRLKVTTQNKTGQKRRISTLYPKMNVSIKLKRTFNHLKSSRHSPKNTSTAFRKIKMETSLKILPWNSSLIRPKTQQIRTKLMIYKKYNQRNQVNSQKNNCKKVIQKTIKMINWMSLRIFTDL